MAKLATKADTMRPSEPNHMPKFETNKPVDFVVVGSGAAGGVVAKELSVAGFQVVVLEQGPYFHESDFKHDELRTRGNAVARRDRPGERPRPRHP